MSSETTQPDQARHKRIAIILVMSAGIELALVFVGWRSPAIAPLFDPVYVIVLLVGAVSIWHALRRKAGHDRRHTDRRDGRDEQA